MFELLVWSGITMTVLSRKRASGCHVYPALGKGFSRDAFWWHLSKPPRRGENPHVHRVALVAAGCLTEIISHSTAKLSSFHVLLFAQTVLRQ